MKKHEFEKPSAKDLQHAGILAIFISILVIFLIAVMTGCNVTRTVTTKAEYYQRGDTTVQIVTRTTESYDGTVKPEMLLK